MILEVFRFVIGIAGIYGLLGLMFSIAFVKYGVARIDPVAQAGSTGFRWLMIPGAIVFWPLLAFRWANSQQMPPQERNAHRDAAQNRPEHSASK